MSRERSAASLIGIAFSSQDNSVKTQKASALLLMICAAVFGKLGTGAAAQTVPGIGAVMTYNVNEVQPA